MVRQNLMLKMAVIITLLANFSCGLDDITVDNIEPVEISPELELSLGEATFTIGELIDDLESEDVGVHTNEQQEIHFIIEKELRFDDIDELISVETVTNDAVFRFPANVPGLPVQQTVPFDQQFVFEFEVDGKRVDSVYFSGGTLDYQMTSDFPASIDYDWVIFKTRTVSDNQDLARTNFLQYTGSSISDSYQHPLASLKTLVENVDGVNTFRVNLEGDMIIEPGESLTTDQGLYFDLTYRDPEFSSIFGYFGQHEMSNQQFDFSLEGFDDFEGEGLSFRDPRISLEIENSFGLEFLLNMDSVVATLRDGSTLAMTHSLSESDRLILAPGQIGERRISTLELNREVSNIDALLSEIPESIEFNVSALANPEASNLTHNFLTDSSYIQINAVVDIPMNVTLHDFEVDFEFSSEGLQDAQDIRSLEVEITVTNQIPFEGSIQLVIMDEFGDETPIQGQFEINSPTAFDNGRVTEPSVSVSTVALSEIEIDALLNSSDVSATVLVSTFGSESNTEVVIYEDYELKLEVGLKGEVVVEL